MCRLARRELVMTIETYWKVQPRTVCSKRSLSRDWRQAQSAPALSDTRSIRVMLVERATKADASTITPLLERPASSFLRISPNSWTRRRGRTYAFEAGRTGRAPSVNESSDTGAPAPAPSQEDRRRALRGENQPRAEDRDVGEDASAWISSPSTKRCRPASWTTSRT